VAPVRITVIEDDENLSALLEVVLRREGFEPEVLRDGRAAVRRLEAGPRSDAVVVDQMLPYRDGLAVAAALRADPRWSAVPIVLLRSAAPSPWDARREARLVDASLSKPFDPGLLVASLRRLLRVAA
jgi:DNA-binding response OmpR family regulator